MGYWEKLIEDHKALIKFIRGQISVKRKEILKEQKIIKALQENIRTAREKIQDAGSGSSAG